MAATVCFRSVSRVLKGSFMGVSIVFVFIEVIAATRAYGGFVSIGMMLFRCLHHVESKRETKN